jgi:hypothetical protein
VPDHDIVSYRDPLDLLHRFVPTPLTVPLKIACADVVLQTNDLSFLPSSYALSSMGSSDGNGQPSVSCLWKIVRDVDVSNELAEASVVMVGNLTVYSMGPACIVAADRERRELLAFLGTTVNAPAYKDSIFPALCRLTEFVTRPASSLPAHVELTAAVGDECNA